MMLKTVIIMRAPEKESLNYLLVSAVVALALGVFFALYPQGATGLIEGGFHVFRVLLTLFFLYYAISEAVQHFQKQQKVPAILYLVAAAAVITFIWLLKSDIVYLIIALVIAWMGIRHLIGSFIIHEGKFFLLLLAMADMMIAIAVIAYPMILALIIAWYVIFWGISRLLLYFEFKKIIQTKKPSIEQDFTEENE